MLEDLAGLVKKRGFDKLTPIQEKSFESIFTGNDVVLIAPTGSGKTEAAFFPILSKLRKEGTGFKILYLTPLKSLNRDVEERLKYWVEGLGMRIAVFHGDTTQTQRKKILLDPPEVLITTPESLQTLLVNESFQNNLNSLEVVVVDELHELIKSKRGVQLAVALKRLELFKKFQLVCLSATIAMSNTDFLKNCFVIQDDSRKELELKILSPGENEVERIKKALKVIDSSERALLFVNTRYATEFISSQLNKSGRKDIGVHHSSISKDLRLEAEKEFKKGKLKAIVCTSSLELGIDIGAIDLIVQYGSPKRVSRLLQRIGRSGHGKGRISKGFFVPLSEMEVLETQALCENALKYLVEDDVIKSPCYDILIHQLVGLVLQKKEITLNEFVRVITSINYFEKFTLKEAVQLAQEAKSLGLVFFKNELIIPSRKSRLYYYENLSTISDDKKVKIKDSVSRKVIAYLDEAFTSEFLNENTVFITRGKPWKVLSVGDDEIIVEPSNFVTSAIPDWRGEDIPVDKNVAQRVLELLSKPSKEFLIEPFKLPSVSLNKTEIQVEVKDYFVFIHTFMGTKANETISKYLQVILNYKFKYNVRTSFTAYTILLEFFSEIEDNDLLKTLSSDKDSHHYYKSSITSSALFRKEFFNVGKRFGLIRKDTEISKGLISKLIERYVDSLTYSEALQSLEHQKFDYNALEDFLRAPKKVLRQKEFSFPARIAMDLGGLREFLKLDSESEDSFTAFVKELLDKPYSLFCTYCGTMQSGINRDLKKEVICNNCFSKRFADMKYYENFDLKKHKKKYSVRLEKEMGLMATQVSEFGARAVIANSVYGIGEDTANQVLRKPYFSDREFYSALLEKQKEFIKNKKYWKI